MIPGSATTSSSLHSLLSIFPHSGSCRAKIAGTWEGLGLVCMKTPTWPLMTSSLP